MPSVLVTETKGRGVELGIPGCSTLKLSPTALDILDGAQPDGTGRGEWFTKNSVKVVLMEQILAERWRDAYGTLGRLLGVVPDIRQAAAPTTLAEAVALTNGGQTAERQKPVQMSLKTGTVRVK
jgi:hypothetical protein